MNWKNYIEELKRRHVFKAGIAYLIVAWFIAQVASLVLPTFEAPPFVMKTILFILAIGFPINLVFAWIYDVTPEGIKKTESLDQKFEKSKLKSDRLNKVIIGSLSIVILLLLFIQFRTKSSNALAGAQTTDSSNNFIGVLPFTNIKPNPETDYFGFAIADQIIGDLSYIKNIIVRPSSAIRKYENKIIDSNSAAHDLKVGFILTGNFLIEKDIIRLNVELVEASTNVMKWRERIEVNFESAFELQDSIARRVVKAMNTQFSNKELIRISKDVPSNPLAYEYYLRSISYPESNEGSQLAIEMINKSIALDSNYAPAHNQLGNQLHILAQYGLLDPEVTKKAEDAYLKAISLNDELLSALGNLALIYTDTGRTEKAANIVRKMLEINPNNAEAHFSLGYIYRYVGMNKEAIYEMEKAVSIDPGNTGFRSITITYQWAGEYKKAYKIAKNYEEVSFTLVNAGYALFRQKMYKESVKYFYRVLDLEPDGLNALTAIGLIAYIEGDIEKGIQASLKFEEINIEDSEAWYFISGNYGLLGDKKGAIRCLKRAVEGGFFNYPLMLRDSNFNAVRDDPDFQEIIELAKKKHLAFKKELF